MHFHQEKCYRYRIQINMVYIYIRYIYELGKKIGYIHLKSSVRECPIAFSLYDIIGLELKFPHRYPYLLKSDFYYVNVLLLIAIIAANILT